MEKPNEATSQEPLNHRRHDLPSTQPHEVPIAHQQDDTRETTQEKENPVNKPQSIPTTADKPQDAPSTESTKNQQRLANSTHSIDLGLPMRCNLCDKEISSKNLLQHCQSNHNIERPNLREHATVVSSKPDSIYQNLEKSKPGIVMATEEGEYLVHIHRVERD